GRGAGAAAADAAEDRRGAVAKLELLPALGQLAEAGRQLADEADGGPVAVGAALQGDPPGAVAGLGGGGEVADQTAGALQLKPLGRQDVGAALLGGRGDRVAVLDGGVSLAVERDREFADLRRRGERGRRKRQHQDQPPDPCPGGDRYSSA